MTKLTKSQIADRLREHGIDLTPSQVKKTPIADLQHQLATELRKTAKPVRVRDTERALPEKVFGEPRKAEDVTPARAGTKRAILLEALHRGTTMDELEKLLGWPRNVCQSAITTDAVNGSGCPPSFVAGRCRAKRHRGIRPRGRALSSL